MLIIERRTKEFTRCSVTHIERHYTLNSLAPELNLEKLQLIATSKASPVFKIKWLEYFNSSASTREACMLPTKPITEDKLVNFLAKACFWARVNPLILVYFLFIEFLCGMSFIYVTLLISLVKLMLILCLPDH